MQYCNNISQKKQKPELVLSTLRVVKEYIIIYLFFGNKFAEC